MNTFIEKTLSILKGDQHEQMAITNFAEITYELRQDVKTIEHNLDQMNRGIDEINRKIEAHKYPLGPVSANGGARAWIAQLVKLHDQKEQLINSVEDIKSRIGFLKSTLAEFEAEASLK